MAEQIADYASLSIWKSFRGQAAVFLVIAGLLTGGLDLLGQAKAIETGAFGGLLVAAVMLDFGINWVLAYFVARGQRWAIAASIVWWSIGKFWLLLDQQVAGVRIQPGATVVSWAIFLPLLINPLRVEILRRRRDRMEEA